MKARLVLAALVSATILTGTGSAAPPAEAAPFAYAVRSDVDGHLYRIDVATGAATDIGATGFGDLESLAFDDTGTFLFGVDSDTDNLVRIDPATGAGTVIGPTGVGVSDSGLSQSLTGNLLMTETNTEDLFRINQSSGAATSIGDTDTELTALATAPGGALFALEGTNGDSVLHSVDPTTGAASFIAFTGKSVEEGGADFDGTGTLWGISDGEDSDADSFSELFTVNTTTGAATHQVTVNLGESDIGGFESLAFPVNRTGGGATCPSGLTPTVRGTTGTAGNDIIFGTDGPDYITGGAGHDIICAFGGKDTIDAGSGDDQVFAGEGNDKATGYSGNDLVVGEAGIDRLFGGTGDDRIDGRDGAGGDLLKGETGRDRCWSDEGDTRRSCER